MVPSPAPGEPWRILEFYSGIGGMRYSLMRSGIRGEVVEAFDINDTANDVYEYNFGHRPFQGNIQTLTVAKLDEYDAHAWLLSPPCQPYTRQGLQKHSADARAFSFVKILELIPQMLHPPLMLFVENVVGFETSDTHEQTMQILSKIGFVTQEYILSPLQFGIPYSRPRYFCLAKRKPLSFRDATFNSQLLRTPSVLSGNIIFVDSHHPDRSEDELSLPCEPIRNFLEPSIVYSNQHEYSKSGFFRESNRECGIGEPEKTDSTCFSNDECGVKAEKSPLADEYIVPQCLIERWGRAMDIVYPDSKRCCCFTKSYYRYVKGTGSLLATSKGNPVHEAPAATGYWGGSDVHSLTLACREAVSGFEQMIDSELEKKLEGSYLKELSLRYFMPREVANLHSFPESFQFPPHLSLRQQYALLGNSLSIAVVAPLLKYLFTEPT